MSNTQVPGAEPPAEGCPSRSLANVSRQHFVMGWGASLLAGCGGDGDDAAAADIVPAKRGDGAQPGSGAYVALPNDLLVDMSDFTIATWVFWNGSQTWARLFDFGTGFHRYMMLTPRAQLRSGKSQYSADAPFNGLIGDFRIYRGALGAAQIASLMAS